MAAAAVTAGRAGAMAARMAETAERLGVGEAGRGVLSQAFAAAMTVRRRVGVDEHHPDYLHPARSALILMEDAHVGDPHVLAAAIITETRAATLRADAAALARLPDEVRGLAAAVPDPGDAGRVLERLVVATDAVRMIAIAERLDHARHLHLRDPAEWAQYHALTCEAYARAAARAHPLLDRRIAWWCRMFRKRFLGGN